MSNNYIVYQSSQNGEVLYIGSGVEGREKHINSGKSHSVLLNKHFFTIGRMDVKILHKNLSQEQSIQKELFLIKKLMPAYNKMHTNGNQIASLIRSFSEIATKPFLMKMCLNLIRQSK